MCSWTPLKKVALLQGTPQDKEIEGRQCPLSQSVTLLVVRSAVGFLNTIPMNTTPEMTLTKHLCPLLYEVCPRFCPTTFHKASQYAHNISGLDFEMQDDAYMSGSARYVYDQGERKISKDLTSTSPLHE